MLSQAISFSLQTKTTQLLLGVEQEFELFEHGERLDFRALFPSVISRLSSVPFRDLDTAVALDAGYMLACDGKCAEFATAPIAAHGDGLPALAREVIRCRRHLLDLLKKNGVKDIRGYSTHVSISVPEGQESEIAEAAASTIGPALILLMEARSSPGLLIRPRRGRLEIGCEYIDDEDQLTAALVFLAGSVQAYLQNDPIWEDFPRIRLNRWEPANIRPGIYLPHDAYGESVYDLGRAAFLELEEGRKITAGEALEHCADLVLKELNGQISPQATHILQEFVWGDRTLQIERKMDPSAIEHCRSYPPVPESKNLQMIVSAPELFGVTPRFVDWEGVAFEIYASEEPVVAGIPWTYLPQFFSDAQTKGASNSIPRQKAEELVLKSLDQLKAPQAYKNVDPAALGTQAHNLKGKKGKIYKPLPPPGAAPISQPPVKRQTSSGIPAKNIAIAVVLILVLIIGVIVGSGTMKSKPVEPASEAISQVPASQAPISPVGETISARIRIITTSDWTTVGLSGTELTGVTIKSSSPEATGAGYDPSAGQFNLNQPLGNAGTWTVEMVADFSLHASVAKNLVVTVDRGDIGTTTVELYAVRDSGQVLIQTFELSEVGTGQNRTDFEVNPAQFFATQISTPLAEQIPARIRIITTSDWTTVGLSGTELTGVTIKSSSPEATGAGYDAKAGIFNLNQPLGSAGTLAVEMVADFSLPSNAADNIAFTIGRGYIGATTVNLYTVRDSKEILMKTFQWSGINEDNQNYATFTIAPAFLSDASKNPVGMNVSIRAAFCSNKIGGLSFNMPEPVTNVNNFQVTSDGNALYCVIVDGRLVCTGMIPDATASGKICGAGGGISAAGCVEFTVQVPACPAQVTGGGNGEEGVTGGSGETGNTGGSGGEAVNGCPAGQTDYCDPPKPGEIPFCGCH